MWTAPFTSLPQQGAALTRVLYSDAVLRLLSMHHDNDGLEGYVCVGVCGVCVAVSVCVWCLCVCLHWCVV